MKTCPDCGWQLSANDGQCPKCGAKADGRAHPLIGKMLDGKYQIEDHLGSGGMCEVYKATHVAMGKKVAIKLLKPELAVDARVAERFEQEARATSRIHHPNAINVIDYGESDGHRPFIVMEYVDGITLGELLKRHGALSVERAANILRQAAGALDAAHAVGVIHRDIKPDNIIIADYDGSDWVEVLDFGVAKIQEDLNRRAALTGANIIVGTPRYMSPEQCEEKPVDARSDVYSLGVVLYEMLTGEVPFQGDSSTRLLVAHASEPPAPLRSKRPDLSAEIESVVMRALSKDPNNRQQSAGELARGLEQAAGLGQPSPVGANRGGAFSRISVPIGAQPEITPLEQSNETTLDDEATVVRRRPVGATVPITNTPGRESVDTPYDVQRGASNNDAFVAAGAPQYQTPAHGTTYVTAPYERRSHAGWIIGTLLLLVVAGVASYIAFGDKIFGPAKTGDNVVDALEAVTDAQARVESLPQDHPLRRYLPQLLQWQGELRAYQQINDRSPQTVDKAGRYMKQAEDISAQARTALASLREGGTVSNTAPTPLNSNQPSIPASAAAPPTQPGEGGESAQPSEPEPQPAEKEKKEPAKEGTDSLPPPPPPLPEEGQDAQNSNRKPRKPPAVNPVNPNPADSKPKNSNRPPEPVNF